MDDYEREYEYRQQAFRQTDALERIAALLEKHFDNQAELDATRASWRDTQAKLLESEARALKAETRFGCLIEQLEGNGKP